MFYNQVNNLENIRLPKLNGVTANRTLTLDSKLATKKDTDDSLGQGSLIRINHPLQNILKVTVNNSDSKLTKIDKIHTTDTTVISYRNQ